MMIIKMGEQILTILEAPVEDDAFEYSPNYDNWVEVLLSKERGKHAGICHTIY